METAEPKNFLFDTILPKIERVGWLLTALGLGLLYTIGYPANKMLSVGLLTLAVVYFLCSFAPVAKANLNDSTNQSYRTTDSASEKAFLLDVLLSKIQDLAMVVTLVGILFKVSFLPNSVILLQVAVSILLVTTVTQLAVGKLVMRAAIVLILGITAWATPVETLVWQSYRHNPVLLEKALYVLKHPEDRAAVEEVRRLRRVERGR
jgi:hypothetical protein